jgi:hypothetical protein
MNAKTPAIRDLRNEWNFTIGSPLSLPAPINLHKLAGYRGLLKRNFQLGASTNFRAWTARKEVAALQRGQGGQELAPPPEAVPEKVTLMLMGAADPSDTVTVAFGVVGAALPATRLIERIFPVIFVDTAVLLDAAE